MNTLVAAQRVKSADPGCTGDNEQSSKTSIAVADLHTVLRDSLVTVIGNQSDMRVVGTASNLSALVDVIHTSRPQVVIVDFEFFSETGLDRLREITLDLDAPQVILLMAREEREPAVAAIRMGVSACVLKQAPLGELLSAIRSVASGQMWMSPALLTLVLAEYRAAANEFRAREQVNRLTSRELEVLQLMVSGNNRRTIARKLHVSNDTVRTHTQNLEKKLSVHSEVAAVSVALKAGLRPDDEPANGVET